MRRLLMAALFIGGCSGDLPAASIVDKLRVLAVRAEPPEVRPLEASTLDALVVPSPLAPSPLSYLWLACREDPAAVEPACLIDMAPDGGAPASCATAPDASPCFVGDAPSVSYAPPESALAAGGVLVALVVADAIAGGATGCASDAWRAARSGPRSRTTA